MKYKLLTIFVILSLFVITVSCNDSTPKQNDKEAAEDTNDTLPETAMEDMRYVSELPGNLDFKGRDFTFIVLAPYNSEWEKWVSRDIYTESETGEPINDAVFRRNCYVEEKLNVNIRQYSDTDYFNKLQRSVKAGDNDYDAVRINLTSSSSAVTAGLLAELDKIPYLNMEKLYWNKNAMDEMSVLNRQYFLLGDMNLLEKDASTVILFNKKLQTDYQMEDMYALVKENKWTLDKIHELARGVGRDLDSDGKLDYDDMLGYMGIRDTATSMLVGAGGSIASKDENDVPVLNLTSQKSAAAIDKIFDIMYDASAFYNLQKLYNTEPGRDVYKVAEAVFDDNRALFYWVMMREVESFRNMETDFGILPLPKYDEAQKNYITTFNVYTGTSFGIPVNADLEFAGAVLEAMCESAYKLIIPQYFDINLYTKNVRDDESLEMLDIIFNSVTIDIGAVYNFGSLRDSFMDMTMKDDRNLVSMYEKREASAIKDIDKFIAEMEKSG
ncbi:MAG: hypothetical protein FWD23_06700 [Oscillospiraceae bacterium]|nr:hypothetical protein [Oscillospiraceae bacterium]